MCLESLQWNLHCHLTTKWMQNWLFRKPCRDIFRTKGTWASLPSGSPAWTTILLASFSVGWSRHTLDSKTGDCYIRFALCLWAPNLQDLQAAKFHLQMVHHYGCLVAKRLWSLFNHRLTTPSMGQLRSASLFISQVHPSQTLFALLSSFYLCCLSPLQWTNDADTTASSQASLCNIWCLVLCSKLLNFCVSVIILWMNFSEFPQ